MYAVAENASTCGDRHMDTQALEAVLGAGSLEADFEM